MPKKRPIEAKTRRGNRICRNRSLHKGEENFAEHYSFRIKKRGELHRLNLGSNIEKAKQLADLIQAFLSVPSSTFADLFDHADFDSVPKPRIYEHRRATPCGSFENDSPTNQIVPLISEIIGVYKASTVHLSPTTVINNVNALRHISAGILGLRAMTNSSSKKQRIAWRKRVGNVSLHEFSQIALEGYRNRIVRAAGEDGIKRGRAVTTTNTYFRFAKSIFADRMMPFYHNFAVPDPLPLRSIRPIREPSRRYVSKIDVSEIIKAAHEHFWDKTEADFGEGEDLENSNGGKLGKTKNDRLRDDKARFIILLLTISCGLRPKEVSRLTWEQVDFERKQICVAVTSYDTPKARSSEAPVDVSDQVLTYLSDFKKEFGIPPFVIPCASHAKRIPLKRAQGVFRGLNKWLRRQGVDNFAPLYIFRKEAGSMIFEQTQSYDMAADFLRNDPRIAREHYVGRKKRLQIEVPGLVPANQFS